MLVEKVHEYLTGSNTLLDENLLSAMHDTFVFSVKRQLMEQKGVSKTLRGSNPGPCARRMAYAFLGFDESKAPDARARITWLTGDLLELVSVAVLKLAGINVTNTCLDTEGQLEGFFQVGNGLMIPCHADGKINIQIGVADEPHLLEIKSTTDHSFKYQWLRGLIGDQYMLQHQVYLETFGLERGVFFVVNKNTGHFHEVLTQKDPEFVEWARKNYAIAGASEPEQLPAKFSDHENYGRLLEKDGRPSQKIAWGCRYCPFMFHCWAGVTVNVLKNTVECTAPISENEEFVTRFGLNANEQIGLDF